jgi:hypothetical protein
VIILHQDDWVFLFGLLDYRRGKLLVNNPIMIPVTSAKHRANMGEVAEGPETFIGKSIVIALLFLG